MWKKTAPAIKPRKRKTGISGTIPLFFGHSCCLRAPAYRDPKPQTPRYCAAGRKSGKAGRLGSSGFHGLPRFFLYGRQPSIVRVRWDRCKSMPAGQPGKHLRQPGPQTEDRSIIEVCIGCLIKKHIEAGLHPLFRQPVTHHDGQLGQGMEHDGNIRPELWLHLFAGEYGSGKGRAGFFAAQPAVGLVQMLKNGHGVLGLRHYGTNRAFCMDLQHAFVDMERDRYGFLSSCSRFQRNTADSNKG